jgi:hypothetical protein
MPSTRAGRAAVWLALAFVVWLFAWAAAAPREVVPLWAFIVGSLAGLSVGVAAGIVAIVAIVREGERGALVFAALVPALFAAGLLVYELLVSH